MDRILPDLLNYSFEYKLNTFLKSDDKLKNDVIDYINNIMANTVSYCTKCLFIYLLIV